MSALPLATAQRVANLRSGEPSPPATASPATASPATSSRPASSRLTAPTASSLSKQTEAARTSRHQLPTIAGSPSASTNGTQSNQSTISSAQNLLAKETPTKIPRMASQSSTVRSPSTLKSANSSGTTSRRTSLNLNTYNPLTDTQNVSLDEFGVLETSDANTNPTSQAAPSTARTRASPQSVSRVPRSIQGSLTSTGLPRKSTRDSMVFGGLRKASTGSIAMLPPSQSETSSAPAPTRTNRLSMLSPSKSLKLLTPKLTSSKSAAAANTSTPSLFKSASAASSRQSLSSPSPAPTGIDEDEILGDEEMMAYIKRQQARKLANGAKKEELDELLKFPEPITPVSPMSPTSKSSL